MDFAEMHLEFQDLAYQSWRDHTKLAYDFDLRKQYRMSVGNERSAQDVAFREEFNRLDNLEKVNYVFRAIGKKETLVQEDTLQDPCDHCNVSLQTARGKVLLRRYKSPPKWNRSGSIRFD